MNLLLVVLWAFALPYPRFRPMASCLSTVWTCIIIVCKMLYQLKVVNPQDYASNCTEVRARAFSPGLLCPGWVLLRDSGPTAGLPEAHRERGRRATQAASARALFTGLLPWTSLPARAGKAPGLPGAVRGLGSSGTD